MTRVLVVDDSLTVRMDLQEALEAAGLDVVPAADLGQARLRLARGGVDLVVLDVVLPDGSGLDLLEELRREPRTAATPIILLSSHAAVADRVRGLQAGADDYAGKPYDRAYLVSRALELVQGRAASDRQPGVLLIEDSDTFREEARAALESAGYRVRLARTGREGLAAAAREPVQAVVVDCVLPDIDAPAFVRSLRNGGLGSEVPCLLLTGTLGRTEEVERVLGPRDGAMRKDEGLGLLIANLSRLLRTDGAAPAAGTRPEPGEQPGAGPTALGPKKLLAVDDSEVYLRELAEVLRSDGYDVICARSGEEALELLSVRPVDCILLDLRLPGLSGRETCRRIKGSPAWRDIPVVMLTVHEDRRTMLDVLNLGADDYIAKSSDLEVLRARVRAQLRRKEFEAENRLIRDELHRAEIEASQERAARQLAESRATLLAELEEKNRELEVKNRELEVKNRELEEFAYVTSHDLQAPLRAVAGFAELLAEASGDRLDQESKEYLELIMGGAARMQALIRGLLAYSRLSTHAHQLELTEVETALERALENLRLEVEDSQAEVTHDPLPAIRGDLTQLTQLLQNLIGNAIKYRSEAPPRVHIGVEDAGREWQFRVSDNGIGIAPEHQARIFRIFQRLHTTAEYPGTGIGLAICKKVVERHGGRIWVESDDGRGSSFVFTIPKPRPDEPGERLAEEPARSEGRG